MKCLLSLSFFIFIWSAVHVTPVWAQQIGEVRATDYRQSYMASPYYKQMADQALSNKPANFDFMQFRSLYSRTRQYDPMGAQTLKELNELAYIVMTDTDPERVKIALFGYQQFVKAHLAHIDVVLQALSLARQDKRFGKSKFFEWMRDGLMKTVVISGDGYTLDGAYDVITLSEETMLFRRLGFQQQHSQMVKEGIIYYNMHDVLDMGTGKNRAVFVNTSIPMRYLEALKDDQTIKPTSNMGQ